MITWFNLTWLILVGGGSLQDAMYGTKSCDMKLNTPARQSQQQIWWLPVSQLFMAVNYATKLMVVIFNTCFRFANSVGTCADTSDSVHYITLLCFNK